MGFDMSFDIPNGESDGKTQGEVDFWLSQGLTADQIFECVKTSKRDSKASAGEAFKKVIAALIDKNAKLEVASHEVQELRLENVRLKGDVAGLEAANCVLQGELKKALKGIPVGLPSKAKVKAKGIAKAKEQQQEAAQETEPEKKSFLDSICETVLERLGPCTRGADGGPCELKHPPDCTKPACHAKGGRKATGCEGWHLFMKYSELRMERKERKDTNKKKAAKMKSTTANKLPDGSNKSNKGNANPGNKAAPSGKQQRGKRGRVFTLSFVWESGG